LRIAHLTDVHVHPDNQSSHGLIDCLRHVQQLPDVPELILNGGDAIGDAFHASAGDVHRQWDLWDRVIADECRLPIEHCLGNHDVWGGNRQSGDESLSDGKRLALDALGLTRPYRSFERAGWHFVVLDSIAAHGDGYQGRLDEEQFEWLKEDLGRVARKTPVLVLSHIPILTVCALFDGANEKSGQWVLPAAWAHIDARRLKDLFREHPNVKLCLSGHIHLRDRVEYDGVTYICDGAVCGNWWKGAYQGFEPGYGLIDLHADGRFEHQFVTYG
jgi:3',5'-cyclic AMP phosphodiesterase CpdA